ncbi:MFS transporter [Streptomyces sp. NPDC006514]|uniref:MFS transporter n=1 Tax=Streptomyces sp. NPDC006514 TaxID=3154308 RepID=UPI0033BEFFB3
MAALMIPGGKLTDRYGRKRCLRVGLVVYGIGALMSAAAPGPGVLIRGNSTLEGVGTALLIPPVSTLTTLIFTNLTSRARAFGVIMALGGIGAAAGPLIGAFVFQALVIVVIIVLSRTLEDPLPPDPTRPFDTTGAVLSAVGLVLVVMGILAADNNVWLMIGLLATGALVLLWSTALFRNRTSNLGLVTQNVQWLLLMAPRSPSRPTFRSYAGTTRSRPEPSSRPPPSACSRRRSPPNAWRSGDPRGP